MDCDELDELIDAEGGVETLPAAARSHLAGCARCRERIELHHAIERLLAAREVVMPPDGFTAQVIRRVRQERWRVEQVVDAGFNAAMAAGILVVIGGIAGLLWSLGWISLDPQVVATATTTVAPWTAQLVAEAQTLMVAAVLLSSALALWWWVEGEGGTSF